MFYNNAICDIYIGRGAGKKLMDDMNNAKSSVKIVSPYLSPQLISELIYLKNKNIDIKLITSNNIEDFYGSRERNIYKLITQHRQTLLDKEIIRNKWIDITKILLYINSGLIAILVGLIFYIRDIRILFGAVPVIAIFLVFNLYRSKIKNLCIYSYSYTSLFPFKVFLSSENTNETFIHGKIYLIDDKIAYMGSLNFTKSGTQYNYETRIRTTDTNAITQIKKEIDDLFGNTTISSVNLQFWGSQIYAEPIN